MASEWIVSVLVLLTIVNVGLIGWVVIGLRRQDGAADGIVAGLGGRFDAIERGSDRLHLSLTGMDQGLRHEIATGAGALREGVIDKLSEAETRAAAGRADLIRDTGEAIRTAREAIDGSLGTFGEQQRARLQETAQAARDLVDRVQAGFDGFSQRLAEQQQQLRDKVEESLDKIRLGNDAKLEQMRKAVDEQLQSALEKRLNDSFQRIAEQFAEVQKSIGEVRSVTVQIGDLKRLFSNVKARGVLGEGHLQALLDDVLPAGAYEVNVRVNEGTAEVVEFALRMPRTNKWLAIDAKFPVSDYERLLSAAEAGDRDEEAAARRALERRIRDEAKRIATKYITTQTLEFAVMYLPSEGLYSEVYRMPGLLEAVRRQHKVMVLAPSSVPAFLDCIRVGHLTITLEQNAARIGETLGAVKAEWTRLGQSLNIIARHASNLSSGIRKTQEQSARVSRALDSVEELAYERADELLGIAGGTVLIEGDVEDDDIPVLAPPRVAAE